MSKGETMAMMDSMMNGMVGSMSPEEKQDTMLKLMPEMIKRIKGSEITKMIGELMSGMMFVTHKSRLGFAETVQEIKRRGEEAGWYNPTIHNHLEIERNFGLKDPNKVANVSMCIPRSAYEILKVNKKLSVMMPIQITVFEEEGQVYVTWMNIKMIGKLLGSTVAAVMDEAARGLTDVHEGVVEQEGSVEKESRAKDKGAAEADNLNVKGERE
jgi:uncharacterized protein (DUF302 family)